MWRGHARCRLGLALPLLLHSCDGHRNEGGWGRHFIVSCGSLPPEQLQEHFTKLRRRQFGFAFYLRGGKPSERRVFIADKSWRALPSVDVIDMEGGGYPGRAFRNEFSGKQPVLWRHTDFFQQFTAHCRLGVFAVFDMAARQTPPIRVRPALRTSPGEKNAPIPDQRADCDLGHVTGYRHLPRS